MHSQDYDHFIPNMSRPSVEGDAFSRLHAETSDLRRSSLAPTSGGTSPSSLKSKMSFSIERRTSQLLRESLVVVTSRKNSNLNLEDDQPPLPSPAPPSEKAPSLASPDVETAYTETEAETIASDLDSQFDVEDVFIEGHEPRTMQHDSYAGPQLDAMNRMSMDMFSPPTVRVAGSPLPKEHVYVQDPRHPLPLSDFQVLKTLGTGTFGRVLLVRLAADSSHNRPDNIQHFAMKVLRKSEIVRMKQIKHVVAERNILARIHHPFIVDLYATFQDYLNVYMLLSYVPGGELFSHLRRAGRFTVAVTRFYLGNIVLALRYLHKFDIVYRDLKPENLLLDHRGYLRIADFGFAKVVPDRTWTLCGTPEYLAPEIIEQKGHSKAVDWWACGVLTYEMLVGYPPFYDANPFKIYQKIVKGDVYWPDELDIASQNFIREFLHLDRSKRLGNLLGGAQDVLDHSWFYGVDWDSLERGLIPPPLIPQVDAEGDTRHFTNLPFPDPREIPGLVPRFAPPADQQPDPDGFLFLDF